jgi:hypothetical protein
VKRLITALTALTLAHPTFADTMFHDAAGQITGFARTDSNNVTRFYDSALRPIGPDGNAKHCADAP